ncbi:MAG: rane-anchored mycosin, partial [Micromonosporaceae bacterium]|nr:rane-anchored mycosin [Micromonosporaceae bacterium]
MINSAPRRLVLSLVTALMVALVTLLAPAAPASAAASEVVKYYVVAATFSGSPENLSEISNRFLGAADRSSDVLALNLGRLQPDGGKLTDPNVLHQGWLIVLPWDAVGPGVVNGVLPTGQQVIPAQTPTRTPTQTKAPRATTTPATSQAPGQTHCAGVQQAQAASDGNWAQLRLAPEQAWQRGRGDGVTVAIVDSGVDATVPALSGRVNVGADVVAGSGRGNVDCLGTGTAMAGLIVSQTNQGGSVTGVAPGAVVMPVRIATTSADVRAADEASAIDVAVSAGVTVIALGSYVDVSQPEVLAAITRAAGHDVLVVVGAGSKSAMKPIAEVVRVGAMGIDGRLADYYAAGAVDVVAPGVGVTSLGISGTGNLSGTGTQYAVALVAAQAALIRSAQHSASASEVASRIRLTATALGDGQRPDPQSGWGLINLAASVQPIVVTASPTHSVAAPAETSGVPRGVAWVTVAIAIVIGLLLVWRIRRAVRSGHSGDTHDGAAPDGPVGPDGLPRRQPGSSEILRAGMFRRGAAGDDAAT